ncbi:hypothetical protein ABT033_36085 [Streptomyces pharetrae]|uniref:hypothetical protein n=1 Tax=Streptomyces pharetrae TaxID=291370 RepID=UPI00335A9F4A
MTAEAMYGWFWSKSFERLLLAAFSVLLLFGLVIQFGDFGSDSAVSEYAVNKGCPDEPTKSSVSPIEPSAYKLSDEGKGLSIRLVSTDYNFDHIARSGGGYLPEAWEADPDWKSQLTVCEYLLSMGKKINTCHYKWVDIPGTYTARSEALPKAPTITIHEARFAYHIFETRTGEFFDGFELDARGSECGSAASLSDTRAPARVNDKLLEGRVKSVR